MGLSAALHAQNPPLPQWYIDLGGPGTYPQWYLTEIAGSDPQKLADTVGDGIPDLWKKRTYAPVDVFGSHLDRDGDGLSDLEEFWFGSDPRTYSTMGDGWSDKEKRDNGLDACFKVTPPVAFTNWLAYANLDAQGWAGATALADGFTGAYYNFVHNTLPYSAQDGTLDFWLELRTDRHALLTVGDALTTNSFPVSAGTRRVRIRAALGAPVTLTMDPAPGTLADIPGATNGLWLCAMSIQPYHSNTVVFTENETPAPPPGNHYSVDGILILEQPAGAIHPVSPEPTRLGPTVPKPTMKAQPIRITNGIAHLGNDGEWRCIPCYPDLPDDCSEWPTYGMLGLDPMSATFSGLNPGDYILSIQDARTLLGMKNRHTVTQVVFSASINALYGTVVFEIGRCGVYDGVFGVEDLPWYPSHAPNYYDESICLGLGCVCHSGKPIWHVGFDHDKVKKDNLSYLTNHVEEAYHKTHHCLGIVWWQGGSTNLLTLLAPDNIPSDTLDNLYFTVQVDAKGEKTDTNILVFAKQPTDMKPAIYHIELRHRLMENVVFDRLWITVNSIATYTSYTNWYAANKTNMAWTLTLPKPFTSIDISGELVSPNPSEWKAPEKKSTYLHHDAVYDMRSRQVAGDRGHQACYDARGFLITQGIAAGSADFVSTVNSWGYTVISPGHRKHDVYPFIRALQLDGNPCLPNFVDAPTNLKRPCLYQGAYLKQYLECRPAIPTGTQPRP